MERRPSAAGSLPWIVGLALAAPALALGAVPPGTLAILGGLLFVGVAFLRNDQPTPSLPSWFAIGICSYCALQVIPFPLEWVEVIAARNADVWRETVLLVTSRAPRGVSISIDPSATLRESLKWAYYAGVLFLVTRVVHRQGLPAILWAVFGSVSAVAFVTLAHGAMGADRVYGVFARSFTDGQWALSPLINGNNLAGYMNLGFFVGLALFVEAKSRDLRLLVGLSMAIMAMLSLTSGSRGAVGSWLLGLACAGILLVVRARSRRGSAQPTGRLGLIALLPLAVALLAFVLIPELAMRNLGDKNIDKLHMVRWVAPMVRDHLWLGVGAGAFETGFLPYRVREDFVIWTHPENILTGWLAEFGFPVTLALVVACILPLWRAKRRRVSTARSLALIAVATWFFHNLVDLAVTVPGVFASVVALLGALFEGRAKQKDTESNSSLSSSVLRPLLVVGGSLLVFASFTWGGPSAKADRTDLHKRFEQLRLSDETAVQSLRTAIEQAILRHPADSYLFRLRGAVASATNEQDVLVWLGRALDLEMINPDGHFLLARELRRLGALKQALLELRFAAERSPHLTQRVALQALAWTKEPELLERVVPAGPKGAPVLLELARQLPPQAAKARERFLREATRRDKNLIAAQLTLAEDYARLQKSNPADCKDRTPTCVDSLRAILASLSPQQDISPQESTRVVHLQADLTALSGNPSEAVENLLEKCPRFQGTCLEKAVLLSAEHDLPLEKPTRYLLAVTCPGDGTCAPAHRVVARAHAQATHWASALHHYRAAARHSQEAEDHLAAVRMALRAKLLAEATRSLAELKKSSTPLTRAQKDIAEQLERQLDEQSRRLLLQRSLD